MTQERLSEMLNVTNSTVSNYEKGVSFPEFQTLLKLADYFQVNLDLLVFGNVGYFAAY